MPPGIAVTDDAFLGGAVMALQPQEGYRAGVDAVLLAASVGGMPDGGRVLDAGAGVGVVGLCLARRVPDVSVVMVEREAELAALATANVSRNGFADRVTVCCADLLAGTSGGAPHLAPDSFDVVLANPPFYDAAACRPPRAALRAAAHTMAGESLDDWLRALARLARPGGRATVIHRADALPALLAAFARRFGGVTVRPIQPREGADAHRVLVSGIKGSRGPLRLLPALVLHGADHAFLPPIARLLRQPAGLDEAA